MLPPNPMLRDGDERIVVYPTSYRYGTLNEPVVSYGEGVEYPGTFTQSSGTREDGAVGGAVNGSTSYDVMIFATPNPGVAIDQAIGLIDDQDAVLIGRATDAATRRGYGAWSVPVLVGGIDQDGVDPPISGQPGTPGGGDELPEGFDDPIGDEA